MNALFNRKFVLNAPSPKNAPRTIRLKTSRNNKTHFRVRFPRTLTMRKFVFEAARKPASSLDSLIGACPLSPNLHSRGTFWLYSHQLQKPTLSGVCVTMRSENSIIVLVLVLFSFLHGKVIVMIKTPLSIKCLVSIKPPPSRTARIF